MPRGAPDYSNVRVDQPLGRLYDIGEMAARMGSPVVYDKAGIVIWYTDFEHGLQGSVFGVDHTDSVGSLTASRSYRGSFSCMFNPRSAANSYVNWGRIIHYLPLGPVAAEIHLSTDTDPDAVQLKLIYRDGSRALTGLIYYQTDGGYWKIYTGNAGWKTVLSGFELQQGPGAWHPIKLVIDTTKKSYVRLLVANQVISLTDYTLTDIEDFTLGQLEVQITVNGTVARHAAAYVDGVIVTQQEP